MPKKLTTQEIIQSALKWLKKKYPRLTRSDLEDLEQDAWVYVSSMKKQALSFERSLYRMWR